MHVSPGDIHKYPTHGAFLSYLMHSNCITVQSAANDVWFLCHVPICRTQELKVLRSKLEQLTMAVFVIRKEGQGCQEPPEDIGIIIEGVEVLSGLTSVASACALLLGYIYAISLAYP